MIKFEKDFMNYLPYDRQQYIEFLGGDSSSSIKWYGVSFQLYSASQGERITLKEFADTYESLFKKIVNKFNGGSRWIVNHDDKDLVWFPNDYDNLPGLRALFKQNNIPNTFKGALIVSKKELSEYSNELIAYPYVVLSKEGFLYKDLDISHCELQFIIKISGHLNIDFLSTDYAILKEVIKEHSSSSFIVKEYRNNPKD